MRIQQRRSCDAPSKQGKLAGRWLPHARAECDSERVNLPHLPGCPAPALEELVFVSEPPGQPSEARSLTSTLESSEAAVLNSNSERVTVAAPEPCGCSIPACQGALTPGEIIARRETTFLATLVWGVSFKSFAVQGIMSSTLSSGRSKVREAPARLVHSQRLPPPERHRDCAA